MNQSMDPPRTGVTAAMPPESDDFDGHTLEELNEYLDAGLMPPDPSIDSSPTCRLAIASLSSIRSATQSLLEEEAAASAPLDERWLSALLAAISLNVQAGREIPISYPSAAAAISMTEATVRALVRRAGDSVGGVIMGRCELQGDVTVADSPITVKVELAVLWGEPVLAAAARARSAIVEKLRLHTELDVHAVNITIHDIYFDRTTSGRHHDCQF